jgi:hypothetical protein
MASPPKRDAWLPYETVRFVLVRRGGRTLKPYRGLVIAEKVMANKRWLLVHYWQDDGHPHPHAVLDWVPRADCWPIHVDPNEYGRG